SQPSLLASQGTVPRRRPRTAVDHGSAASRAPANAGSGRPVGGGGPPSRRAPARLSDRGGPAAARLRRDYLMILVTRPAPTVRPPSRIANRRPSSIAIGWISSTFIDVLSPGMHIS